MAQRRKATPPDQAGQLSLKVSRSRAEEVIDRQAESGRALISRAESIGNREEYLAWSEEQSRWRRFTSEALSSVYTTTEPADEFNRGPGIAFIGPSSLAEDLAEDVRDLRRNVNTLVSLRERLEFVPALAEEESDLGAPATRAKKQGEPQVFVVHGHDDETKEKVVRQIEKAGDYTVTVLHEQPNAGRTLIEKFEEYASRSDFAVVLLTADDVGAEAGRANDLERRGRQNVIFELGYFVGALGRARVAVLYEEGVEFPSDYKGIVYIGLGDETWRFKLLNELKAAGLDFDLNKIV